MSSFLLSGVEVTAQVANNMTLLGNWDNNTLPNNSGVVYNDIWGYVDGAGREYAIMGSTQGTFVFDITVPSSPVQVTFQAGGSNNSIWRDYKTYQNYLYAVSDQGSGSSLQIFDLSGLPATVTKVYDSQALFSRAHNIFISETTGRLYVAGVTGPGGQNLMIFDIATDPAAPRALAGIPASGLFMPLGYVHDIHCHNDTCYTFHGTNGMDVINFSNTAAIALIGRLTAYPEQGYSHSGWVTPDHKLAVIADETHDKGLKLVDVSVRPTPTILSTFRSTLLAPAFTNSIAHNPFINGNLAYVAYYHEGLQVFDITNKVSPTLVMGYDTYPDNVDYSGFDGAWGVYPYLPSGNIIVSDTKNGLFILGPTVLPIEMTEFNAVLEDEKVYLTWFTQTEINNEKFTVERSPDGLVWEDLTQLPGAGNSHRIQRYQAIDESPVSGVSYYRIRQTDYDGKQTWSEPRKIATTVEFKLHSVYPVPANHIENMHASISLEKQTTLSVSVVDLLGRICHSQQLPLEAGSHMVEIPTAQLQAGSYRLFLQGQDIREVRQIVVVD